MLCRKMRERRRKDIEMRVIRKLERAEDQKKEEEEEVRGILSLVYEVEGLEEGRGREMNVA